jgi:hypothetical protein
VATTSVIYIVVLLCLVLTLSNERVNKYRICWKINDLFEKFEALVFRIGTQKMALQ